MNDPAYSPFWIFMQDDFRGKGISNGVHKVHVKIKGRDVWVKFPQRVQAKKIRLWQWEKIPSVPDTGQDFADAVGALRADHEPPSCQIPETDRGRLDPGAEDLSPTPARRSRRRPKGRRPVQRRGRLSRR